MLDGCPVQGVGVGSFPSNYRFRLDYHDEQTMSPQMKSRVPIPPILHSLCDPPGPVKEKWSSLK